MIKRPVIFIRTMLLFLSSVSALIFSLTQIICNDIWLHIKTGQLIIAQGCVPHTQLFSFILGNKNWIDHEWLFQIIIYHVYNFLGLNGLVLLRFLIVGAIVAIFIIAAKDSGRYFIFSCLAILLAMAVASSRFSMRPELVSMLLIVAYIYLIKRYCKSNVIYLIFILQVLWNNIHGYSIIGPLLLLIFLAIKLIERYIPLPFDWNSNKLPYKDIKRFFYIFVLLIVSYLFTPYLIEGALYPLGIIRDVLFNPIESKYVFKIVTELQAVSMSDIFIKGNFFFLHALIALFFFSMLSNIRKVELFDIIAALIFLAITSQAVRHIGMCAMAMGLLAIFNFSSAPPKSENPNLAIKISQSAILFLGIIFFFISLSQMLLLSKNIISYRYVYNLKGDTKGLIFGMDKANMNYPIGGSDFIKKNSINGNLLNFFNNGAYLIFKLYPECRVFVDGRTELYGGSMLEVLDSVFKKPTLFEKMSKNLKIDCAVFTCVPNVSKIFKYLYNSKEWALVFFDGQSCVFVRKKSKFKALINKNKIDLKDFHLNLEAGLLSELRHKRPYPALYISMAKFFSLIDMPDKVREIVGVVEDIDPTSYEIYCIKGVALATLGMKEKALDAFNRSAELNPANPDIFQNIGVFYMKDRRPDLAMKYFQAGLKIDPSNKTLKAYLEAIEESIDIYSNK